MHKVKTLQRIFTLAICILLCFSPIAANAHKENKLFKAAFIYNFFKFTNWPSEKWNTPSSTIQLCTIGDDELTHHLKDLNGRNIRSRKLTTVNSTFSNPNNCHLLYIAQSEKYKYRSILAKTNSQPILTVANFKGFSKNGGMIELRSDSGQTQLIINIHAVRHAELEISSRLLILAKVINQDKAP